MVYAVIFPVPETISTRAVCQAKAEYPSQPFWAFVSFSNFYAAVTGLWHFLPDSFAFSGNHMQ